MENTIDVSLAGLTFPCRFRYPETARYFPAPDPAATCVGGGSVCLTDEDWHYFLETGMEACAHTEFSVLTAAFSDALMDYDRMIFHAVAIRWRDKAYLIAAQSGVGKSTQTRFLQELRPGEFSVICGDRPALEFRKKPLQTCHCETSAHTGRGNPSPVPIAFPVISTEVEKSVPLSPPVISTEAEKSVPPAAAADPSGHPPVNLPPRKQPEQWDVIVHPSPWNGKENWYGAEAAPLGGVILLLRGEENRLAALSPREAAIRTYAQVIQLGADPAKMRKAAELVTRMLNSVPVWQLTSFQVPDSTRLLLEAVFMP